MKKRLTSVAAAAFIFTLVFAADTMAEQDDVNIPITASQAFDAVVNQVDPATGENMRVALIDLRTAAEYFWVGACAKVESITTTSGEEFFPYNGKVVMKHENVLEFEVEENQGLQPVSLPVDTVASVDTVDISIHIPTLIWCEAKAKTYINLRFACTINALSADYDVLILMCRTGGRSNTRAFNTSLFKAVYQIDDPDGADGHGGFQGPSYGDLYNGYLGYPGRDTQFQGTASVSWSDAGLPIHSMWKPVKP